MSNINTKHFFSKKDIAEELGISEATVRNWIKTGFIKADNTKNDIEKLKINLSKIDSRANKSLSKNTILPKELTNKDSQKIIADITKLFDEKSEVSSFIYFLVLYRLYIFKELKHKGLNLNNPEEDNFKRKVIYLTVKEYYTEIKNKSFDFSKLISYLKSKKNLLIFDFPGITYQAIMKEGEKSKNGSYYTPADVVEKCVESLSKKPGIILDPCCGTGNFLLKAADKKHLKLNEIIGVDKDKTAVFIAKMNLLIHFKKEKTCPLILNKNFNNEEVIFFLSKKNIDTVITNPPWGAYKNSNSEKENGFGNEIFSLFIINSLNLLKKGGEISFILPESILNVKTHKKLREFILKKHQITEIELFDNFFSGVFTKVIRLNIRKNVKRDEVLIKTVNKVIKIQQNNYLKNRNFNFTTQLTEKDYSIIRKIFNKPHYLLNNSSIWALGIVTGNNKRFIKDNPKDRYQPIIKGADIQRYSISKYKSFIKFHPELFHQSADISIYKAKEKLVYKFISNKPVFALDKNSYLTLNSANILIPKIETYNIKTAMALLNSKVFEYLYKTMFGGIKILKSELQTLPFPKMNTEKMLLLEKKTDAIIFGDAMNDSNEEFIFEIFGLTLEEKKHIISFIK